MDYDSDRLGNLSGHTSNLTDPEPQSCLCGQNPTGFADSVRIRS